MVEGSHYSNPRINVVDLASIVAANAERELGFLAKRHIPPRWNMPVINAICRVQLAVDGHTPGMSQFERPTLRQQLESL